MSKLISVLYQEHKGLKRLLSLMKENLVRLQREESIDHSLLEDSVHYIEVYVDSYHHPKEDVFYQYIIDHKLDSNRVFQHKLDDHDDIKKITQDLKQVLHSINLDIIVSRSSLINELEAFIHVSNNHLNDEEHNTFPLVEKLLTEEDWHNVALLMPEYCEDPLFGRNLKEDYLDLSHRLASFEVC
ncbi:hemerythrin domain-containing protein [Thalassotalea fusca]